ncbi:flagellar biosynthesis protein FliQ [Hathewaya limosa]|uniref:Flagellar biosynthetic protein FliQ n=1 Tax=Hathewaya limosa TaxID=1536 RepID=A0ABU0JQ96_HATLI|nr:flagellar biosynthesis protein FliQ [Hathewaya limosa]AWZ48208.1 flagellar biosynthetic protein FliQ [Clostridiaceae bacterium 14S0207]MDQ0479269.1 flagellar biosynthetic protein FliQ [Hathewaya limosa]
MSENMIISVLKDALNTSILISAPILIAATVVGLVIAILQATTQIQEQTLTFVPKMLVAALVGLLCSSWMLHKSMELTKRIFELIANITK